MTASTSTRVTLDEVTRKALYNKSQQKIIESGYYLNKAEDWSCHVLIDLYEAAKSLLGVDCSDSQILPAIYGDCSKLFAIAKNRYVFWQISSEFYLRLPHHKTREEALRRAIDETRISCQELNPLYFTDAET
jgi:hypothetical protein